MGIQGRNMHKFLNPGLLGQTSQPPSSDMMNGIIREILGGKAPANGVVDNMRMSQTLCNLFFVP